ncbi:MAG: uncharacterized protein JWL62_3855 [Hyphomicrobiales bacterium]|nr:uncharacterized protein [Hyphomicrobiales bacterium]
MSIIVGGRASLVAAILLCSPSSWAASVPQLDIEQTCRSAQKLSPGDKSPYDQCMQSERDALAEMTSKGTWDKASAGSKALCLDQAKSMFPSYVHLAVCLEMQEDPTSSEMTPDSTQGHSTARPGAPKAGE